MATNREATSSAAPRIGSVVLLGAATGAVAWLPLMWLDVPKPAATSVVQADDKDQSEVLEKSPSSKTVPSEDATPHLLSELPGLAGGGIPVETTAKLPDSEPLEVSEVKPAGFIAGMPRPAPIETEAIEPASLPAAPSTLMQPVPQPTRVRVAEEGELPAEVVPSPSTIELQPRTPKVETTDAPPIAQPTRVQNDETDTLRRMYELHDDDPGVAEAASKFLTERGFGPVHLKLARQLTSSIAEDRVRLATQLPLISDIDARLWLTWLLRDDVAEVRLAALSVLATTGDAETIRRAVEIARQDRDPRVRQQLDQIAKRRR